MVLDENEGVDLDLLAPFFFFEEGVGAKAFLVTEDLIDTNDFEDFLAVDDFDFGTDFMGVSFFEEKEEEEGESG